MCLFRIVERPGVSWGVLVCPGVIRLTRSRGVHYYPGNFSLFRIFIGLSGVAKLI